MKTLVRHVLLIAIVLVAGTLLASLDLMTEVAVWRWNAATLSRFISYAAAAVLAAQLASRPPTSILKNAQLERLLQTIALGVSLWLLFIAARLVVLRELVEPMKVAFAVLIIGIVAYGIWQIHSGFDGLIAAVPAMSTGNPAADARTVQASPSATSFCTTCGVAFRHGQRFCGGCGAAMGGP